MPADVHYDAGALHVSNEMNVYTLDAMGSTWTELGAPRLSPFFFRSSTTLFAVSDATLYEVGATELTEHVTINSVAMQYLVELDDGMMFAAGFARAGTPESGGLLAFDPLDPAGPLAYYEDEWRDPTYQSVQYRGLARVGDRIYLLRQPSHPSSFDGIFAPTSFSILTSTPSSTT